MAAILPQVQCFNGDNKSIFTYDIYIYIYIYSMLCLYDTYISMLSSDDLVPTGITSSQNIELFIDNWNVMYFP